MLYFRKNSSKCNKERRLRLTMRKLKGWGREPAGVDSDVAPLLECYEHTRDKGNGIAYLLYRSVA
jgi:hypothetical protein